jgi:hypothetical protein
MKSRLFVGLVFCVVLGQFVALAQDENGPAAIVSELKGSATVKDPGKAQRALEIYDWIGEGASITVSKGSQVVLVLTSGARFALKERSRVTVLRAGLPASADVEPLPPFPPLPVVAPIASAAVPPISAATRVRGSSIRNLYPSGHTTLADGTRLRFDGARGVTGYLVTIEDQTSAPVWRQEIEYGSGAVTVPPDVLEPGRSYRWRVTAIGNSEPPLSARGAFVTLSASAARTRFALRSGLAAGDLNSLILLARVDEQLGLLREARESLATAAAKAPEDKSIQRMLARIEEQF